MPDTVVLVSSWDKNSVLWPVMKHSFDKYWPDCPYPIYFITNFSTAPLGETVKVGVERGWALNTKKVLDILQCKNVIWMLEDYWFNEKVDTEAVEKYVAHVTQGRAGYIRLVTSDETRLLFEHDHSLHYFTLNSPHKTSLGPSIWNKDLLQRLIVEGEDIWHFEMQAVHRTTRKDIFLFVSDDKFFRIAGPHYAGSPYTEQMMIRGRLTESAYQYLNSEHISL